MKRNVVDLHVMNDLITMIQTCQSITNRCHNTISVASKAITVYNKAKSVMDQTIGCSSAMQSNRINPAPLPQPKTRSAEPPASLFGFNLNNNITN